MSSDTGDVQTARIINPVIELVALLALIPHLSLYPIPLLGDIRVPLIKKRLGIFPFSLTLGLAI